MGKIFATNFIGNTKGTLINRAYRNCRNQMRIKNAAVVGTIAAGSGLSGLVGHGFFDACMNGAVLGLCINICKNIDTLLKAKKTLKPQYKEIVERAKKIYG